MKVSTVQEMHDLDRVAMERYGIPGELLMENAGEAAYFVILSELEVRDTSFVILCGGGHNGGDGLVVARKLSSSGGDVEVFLLSDPEAFDGAPRLHLEMAQKAGIPIRTGAGPDEIEVALAACDVVVDAMLGTGISREVGGLYRDVIAAVNDSGAEVVSLDIPSGVDGDTGRIWGAAVEADLTVTFGLPKRGNLLYPGAANGGLLYVSHISFPPQLYENSDIQVEINVPAPLPPRRPDGHKGSFGDALFVAGAAGYFGAPAFAALSMLKAGGGYSRLAAPRSAVPHIAPLAGEVVYVPQAETAEGTLGLAAFAAIADLAANVDFVVVGPGLSLQEETQELVRRLAAEVERPLLVDGDGLTAVAAELNVIRRRARPTVLTPHVGEAARLAGCTVDDIAADPVASVQRLATDTGAIVVLKGAHSLIGMPDGRVFINTSGNSGMATAGSGDVLTGAIAAMYGLGLELEEAVKAGVFVHGLAGDLAADEIGEDGVTARDALGYLPEAVAALREDYEAVTDDCCGAVAVV